MCVTSQNAELTATYIGVWDIYHPKWGYRHVLAYENASKNLADSPNCMLLHVPSSQPLLPEHIINTEKDPNFLSQIAKPFLPANNGFSRSGFEGSKENYVLEMGIYHIALLNNVNEGELKLVLENIPKEKQPLISLEFIDFYTATFPGFPLVLCCFNNKESKKASPVMLHFAPHFPDTFLFPTLEAHGTLPDIGENHRFHQTIVTGSYQLKEAGNGFAAFDLSGISEALQPYLPRYGAALRLDYDGPNLDVLLEAIPIREGGDAEISLGILA